MRSLFLSIGICLFLGCKNEPKKPSEKQFFSQIEMEIILEDSISVRAIEIKEKTLFYAGNDGKFGYIHLKNPQKNTAHQIVYGSLRPGFRSIASTSTNDFLLSVANPALLFEVDQTGDFQLNYSDRDSLIFYDSMAFWNDREGIAMGDPTEDCLSILITRDGGKTWKKTACENLPKTAKGEAAFAASNSNIAIVNDKTWLISGGVRSRVYFSADKGKTWTVHETPLVQGKATTGGYSIDFYDEKIGVIFGGDYTQKEKNLKNKAITFDGGKTWELLANGKAPGYKSCVQFVPNSGGKELVAIGPTGISYSHDTGKTWSELSEEGFFTLRFANDSTAYAAGKNRIARLIFK